MHTFMHRGKNICMRNRYTIAVVPAEVALLLGVYMLVFRFAFPSDYEQRGEHGKVLSACCDYAGAVGYTLESAGIVPVLQISLAGSLHFTVK